MTSRQILVLSGSVLLGAAIYFAPRNAGDESQQPEAAVVAGNPEFDHQLEEVKKETDVKALASVEFFESRLKLAKGDEKVIWLDSLTSVWDRNMRPGIAAEYSGKKAALTGSGKDWLEAGERFLGLSRFFADQDKQALAGRAVTFLEKAQEIDSTSLRIRTQLGIAYVDGSAEPMKGIMLLRGVVAEDSANVDAQLSLGFFSMQSGQYDKAEKRFRTVLRFKPELTAVRLYLSDALSGEGKDKEALNELMIAKGSANGDTMLLRETESRIQRIKSSS